MRLVLVLLLLELMLLLSVAVAAAAVAVVVVWRVVDWVYALPIEAEDVHEANAMDHCSLVFVHYNGNQPSEYFFTKTSILF